MRASLLIRACSITSLFASKSRSRPFHAFIRLRRPSLQLCDDLLRSAEFLILACELSDARLQRNSVSVIIVAFSKCLVDGPFLCVQLANGLFKVGRTAWPRVAAAAPQSVR